MRTVRYILPLVMLFLISCAPAFHEEIMKNSTINPSLPVLNAEPKSAEGRMFIVGGRVINTRSTKDGQVIEAALLPVTSRAYIDSHMDIGPRFMAFLPKSKGTINPAMFPQGVEISVAGIFRGVRTQKLGDMEYEYSYFEIVGLRLWNDAVTYAPIYYYPYPYYYPGPYYYWWYSSPGYYHHHHHRHHRR